MPVCQSFNEIVLANVKLLAEAATRQKKNFFVHDVHDDKCHRNTIYYHKPENEEKGE